jgi:hypothetical protein
MPRNIRIREEMTELRKVCYGICFNMSIVLDKSYFLSYIYLT